MAQDSSPLSPSPASTYKRPNHNRQSSTRSLSFLILSSSPSSYTTTTSSSYRPSPNYTAMPVNTSALGLQVPTPLHPNFTRRASDGYTSGGSTVGSETVTPSTPTPMSSNQSSFASLSSPTRVKRSCSTSALTALSLSSASSPRIRQITGKATVA